MTRIRFGTAAVVTLLGFIALAASWPAAGQALNPQAYEPVTAYGQNGPVTYYQVKSADPELQKLHAEEVSAEREVAGLLAQYAKSTEDAARSKAKAKLSTALEKQFDLQQQRRELEASRIETQLKKLRELMKKRTDARQTIVEKRLDQLVREADGLGWTSPPASAGSPFSGTSVPGFPAVAPTTAQPVGR
jgi:hypothetical protein